MDLETHAQFKLIEDRLAMLLIRANSFVAQLQALDRLISEVRDTVVELNKESPS